jgi:hypothetical protein
MILRERGGEILSIGAYTVLSVRVADMALEGTSCYNIPYHLASNMTVL